MFIREEMRERGWGLWNFLVMARATAPEDELGWRVYFRVGRKCREMTMGRNGAEQLALAFGTSAELWLNLEKAWREAQSG